MGCEWLCEHVEPAARTLFLLARAGAIGLPGSLEPTTLQRRTADAARRTGRAATRLAPSPLRCGESPRRNRQGGRLPPNTTHAPARQSRYLAPLPAAPTQAQQLTTPPGFILGQEPRARKAAAFEHGGDAWGEARWAGQAAVRVCERRGWRNTRVLVRRGGSGSGPAAIPPLLARFASERGGAPPLPPLPRPLTAQPDHCAPPP
ncbi:hypothetical protein CALCODRAFT_359963 [Calocera cornea HHB12733]|uniref:Uncharacterized protein n=1 Tax=Calocera cornea HHB12733 TaxID=1353952 RepID=A0A165EMF4_9BASI|nr:hypothetical protein CALCODRAFT_359963 [Calocera cornea HHB12733]